MLLRGGNDHTFYNYMLKTYFTGIYAITASLFVAAVLMVANVTLASELPPEGLIIPLAAPMEPATTTATTTESTSTSTPTTTPMSVVITDPSEDGETLMGEHTFTAQFTDNDTVTNEFDWYILTGDCEDTEESDYMAGIENEDLFTFDGANFSATVDMTEWYGGWYCFVVDPIDGDEDTPEDVFDQRSFYLEELYLIGGYKFEDTNANGMIDEEEDAVVGGFTIVATREGEEEMVLTTVTDNDGWYGFLLPQGEWIISEENQTGWEQIRAVSRYPMWDIVRESAITEEVVATTCTVYVGGKMARLELSAGEVGCDFLNRRLPEPERNTSSGTKVGVRKTGGAPKVLGAATTTASATTPLTCEGMYLKDYLRLGRSNDAVEVMKLQIFLNAVGIVVPITSVFDEATDQAVRTFQLKYLVDVLTPWDISEATGYVYKTTRAKINNMVCPGSEAVPQL